MRKATFLLLIVMLAHGCGRIEPKNGVLTPSTVPVTSAPAPGSSSATKGTETKPTAAQSPY